jgi:hypothetical protein
MDPTLFETFADRQMGDLAINYGLGVLLMMEDIEIIGAKKGTLVWGGLLNLQWWANRERGVAGFYATRIIPHSHPKSTELAALSRGGYLEDD